MVTLHPTAGAESEEVTGTLLPHASTAVADPQIDVVHNDGSACVTEHCTMHGGGSLIVGGTLLEMVMV